MSSAELLSFEESVRRESQGYVDDATKSSSSVGSSILGLTEWEEASIDNEEAMHINNEATPIVEGVVSSEEELEAATKINIVGEWDGMLAPHLPVPGYN